MNVSLPIFYAVNVNMLMWQQTSGVCAWLVIDSSFFIMAI